MIKSLFVVRAEQVFLMEAMSQQAAIEAVESNPGVFVNSVEPEVQILDVITKEDHLIGYGFDLDSCVYDTNGVYVIRAQDVLKPLLSESEIQTIISRLSLDQIKTLLKGEKI